MPSTVPGTKKALVVPFRILDRGTLAGVAQLDRASVYETEGYRFESCHPRFLGRFSYTPLALFLHPLRWYTALIGAILQW